MGGACPCSCCVTWSGCDVCCLFCLSYADWDCDHDPYTRYIVEYSNIMPQPEEHSSVDVLQVELQCTCMTPNITTLDNTYAQTTELT